jgi:hypothetical protein
MPLPPFPLFKIQIKEINTNFGQTISNAMQGFGPRPSFVETLVMFDHFWDFDRLVEDGAPRRSGDRGISPFLRDFWVLGFM